MPRFHVAVMVNGCYWHLHDGCPAGRLPTGNRAFWKAKLEGNKRRDSLNRSRLRRLGWRVLTVWECEIERDLDAVGRRLVRALHH